MNLNVGGKGQRGGLLVEAHNGDNVLQILAGETSFDSFDMPEHT